jgi:hypothetical protein
MTAHLNPAVFPKLIKYFPEHWLLYCHTCKNVHFPSSLDRHVGFVHKIAKKHRQPVIEYCQTLPVAVALGDLALRSDNPPGSPSCPSLTGLHATTAASLHKTGQWYKSM